MNEYNLLVLIFLAIALLLYLIFAGADFGMGMLELSVPKSKRERLSKLSYQAIGPVWEVNHIWIILVVVILFVAYPRIYATLSVVLHIPLSLFLLGIIIRGCAFTFRHYDAFEDGSARWYSFFFRLSSVWTPLLLGICVGVLGSGTLLLEGASFYRVYLAPSFSFFPLCAGILLCLLCMTLASVFVLGEEMDEDIRILLRRRALFCSFISYSCVLFLLFIAAHSGARLSERFWVQHLSPLALAGAACCLALLAILIAKGKTWSARTVVVAYVSILVSAWFAAMYPHAAFFADDTVLVFTANQAPESTLKSMLIALVCGLLFIFPSLGLLLWTFKGQKTA